MEQAFHSRNTHRKSMISDPTPEFSSLFENLEKRNKKCKQIDLLRQMNQSAAELLLFSTVQIRILDCTSVLHPTINEILSGGWIIKFVCRSFSCADSRERVVMLYTHDYLLLWSYAYIMFCIHMAATSCLPGLGICRLVALLLLFS